MFTSVLKIICNYHFLNKYLNYFIVLVMIYRIKKINYLRFKIQYTQ